MTITINVDAHWRKAQGFIENIAMCLEKYGDVRILSVEAEVTEAISFTSSKTKKGGRLSEAQAFG